MGQKEDAEEKARRLAESQAEKPEKREKAHEYYLPEKPPDKNKK